MNDSNPTSQTTDRWLPVAFLAVGLLAGSGLTIAFLPFQIFIAVVEKPSDVPIAASVLANRHFSEGPWWKCVDNGPCYLKGLQ